MIAVAGDLTKPNLGVADADLRKLKGKVEHLFHLAAVYDLSASAEAQHSANVDGTRNTVGFADSINAGVFHHVSSIAAAGLYDGVFREDMFEEAEDLDHPYFRTKHDAEAVVRRESKRPFRVYRPGFVVGHSKTGFIDKIDGPYYFFKAIQKMRQMLPPWMPTIGIEGGRINIVPVDFVAERARPYRAQEGARRQDVPPDRSRAEPDRRSAEHLRRGGARAEDDDAHQRADVRLHSRADHLRARVARAGEARDASRAVRPRHPARRVPVHQLADALRQPRGGEGAEGVRHRGAAARDLRLPRCGTTGNATSIRTSSSTAACRAR